VAIDWTARNTDVPYAASFIGEDGSVRELSSTRKRETA